MSTPCSHWCPRTVRRLFLVFSDFWRKRLFKWLENLLVFSCNHDLDKDSQVSQHPPLGTFLYSFSLPSPLPVSTNWSVSFCFVLHLPVSRFPSINTELSVTGVTIGSCRYSVEGHRSVYRFQLLKCYQLPIYNHTHTAWHAQKHTHASTHSPYSLCILITLDHRWHRKICFGSSEIRSGEETKNHLLTIQYL